MIMKKTSKKTKEHVEDINIILRCKPSNISQSSNDRWSCLDVLPDCRTIRFISPSNRQDIKDFSYNKIFHSFCYQEEVYEPIKDLISDAILGYNATIITYGPVG